MGCGWLVNTISRLSDFLHVFVDHPVVDKTGLAGVYEIDLKVEMDDPQAQFPQPGQMFQGFQMGPGIFTAVEQLGLKLVAEKAPREVLVVDHVERPSAN